MLESLLRPTDACVGSYTSPHVNRFNERVAVDGEAASDAELVAAIERVDALRTRMQALGARGMLVYDPKFCEPELFDQVFVACHSDQALALCGRLFEESQARIKRRYHVPDDRAYSLDGEQWTRAGQFDRGITVRHAGVMAATNGIGGTAPAGNVLRVERAPAGIRLIF